MSQLTEALEPHEYAYLTTRGRISGRVHRIEIWFVMIDGSVWMNSGGRDRSDWVKNLVANPDVVLEIGENRWPAVATTHPTLAEHPARERLGQRYQGWQPGRPLTEWATQSLLVEVVVADAC